MTQTSGKIEGKFYPLKHEEFIHLSKKLNSSEFSVYLWLKTNDPFGDRLVEADTKAIALDLNISRRTVQRALVKLFQEKLIDLVITKIHYRVRSVPTDDTQVAKVKERLKVATPVSPSDTSVAGVTPTSPERHPCRRSVTHVAGASPMSPPSPESLTEQAPHAPKTIKTIQTDQTLSDWGEGEKKTKVVVEEIGKAEASERLSSQPETFNSLSLVEAKDPVEDKFSAAPRYKTLQQRVWDWLPDGPWKMSDGKLDPQFRDFVANDWLSRWGGDIHQRRADVLAHFKKDPANLPIRWEQYASEYRHRYENTKLLLDNGMSIKEDYQQRLIDNHRALTEPLPPELDPVARQQTAISPSTTALSPSKKALGRESQQLALPLPDLSPEGAGLGDAPCQENAAAYRVFQPEPIEDPIAPAQFEEFKRSLSQMFSMPNGNRAEAVQPPKSEIEELNLWLADPLLRKEVMPRVMKSDRYTVEFDEEGVPFRVVEVKDRDDLSEE